MVLCCKLSLTLLSVNVITFSFLNVDVPQAFAFSINIWLESRQDLLTLYLQNHLLLDDFFIEALNHLIMQSVHDNSLKTTERIIEASSLVGMYHALKQCLPTRTRRRSSEWRTGSDDTCLTSYKKDPKKSMLSKAS